MITPLKRMLFEREITNTELSRAIGLTRTNTGKIVNGDTVPSLIVAMKIARFLGVSVEDLWGHLLTEEETND
jgi:DNA-binding XRE family transcriptional regulator